MPRHPGVQSLSRTYYARDALDLTVTEFIKELDRADIDKVILLTACWKGQPARQRNEATAELVSRYPTRFIGFGSFDPNAGRQVLQDVEHAIKGLGLAGIKTIGQNVEVFYNDPSYYPVYEKVQELRVPILFHTGASFLGTRTKFGNPATVDDVALDFPDMNIILAHMGMHRYLEAHSLLVRYPNVYADLSFWPLHPIYRRLIPWSLLEETVPEKLLMGSDFPVGQTPTEVVQSVRSLPVSEQFKAQILGENAAKLLGL